MQRLNQITVQGGIYLGLRYGLGILISLGNMLVLTWWIGPHAYGLFVTAVGLSGFLASLVRAGVDTYLVRMEKEPSERLYHLALTVIGGNALVLLLLGTMTVPLLARWFGSREFELPYLATLITIPLAGWAGPPTAKLERALDFGRVAGIELGGQLLALAVSLTLAWKHMGVWAPVAGLIAWQLSAMVAALRAARMVPRFAFDRHQAMAMFSFGVGYTMSLRAWQLRTLINPLIVGRMAGADNVAYVGLAIRIAEGLGFVRVAAGRLAIAALSRLQDDLPRLRMALQKAIELQVMVLGPLLCVFSLAGPFLFAHLIGLRWLPSLAVFPWIAAAVPANSVYNLQASALFVLGEQWTVFGAYLVQVGLLGLAAWILLPRLGILGYGLADVLACAGYAFLHRKLAVKIGLSLQRVAGWLFSSMLPLCCSLQMHPLVNLFLWTPLALITVVEVRRWRKQGRLPQMMRPDPVPEEELGLASTGD
jgi:O-antigen/teichoic acid export membrane protein